MEESFIPLDLYPIIIKELDWSTLQNFKLSNSFCYDLYKNEVINRINSPYPFGEEESLIKIIVDDIYLDEIYCVISDIEIEITPDKISMPYVSDVLTKWFHYSFRHNKWILTGKIIKSILRLNNKLPEIDRITNILTLLFSFKDGKSFLIDIR